MRIGVDVGGTKIEAIALDDGGVERARTRIATPRDDYPATIAAIRDLVVGLEARIGRSATVGIGMPGTLSPSTGRVMNANSTWLNGKPFDTDVRAALDRLVRFENDANCFALSEAIDGAGAGHRVVFGVILGTGVGGGIVIDRAVLAGRHAIAGEWGHNGLPRVEPADLPMPACWCGRTGCIETYLSGPALAADHRSRVGGGMSTRDLVAAADRGDGDARDTMARYERRLAKSLASVVNVLDPDVIVLGGGLSSIDALYARVPPMLAAFVFADVVTTPIVRPRHGDASGVRGAAWLWPKAGLIESRAGVRQPCAADGAGPRDNACPSADEGLRMTTSFPKRGIDRRSMPAAVLAVLLSLGVAQPSTAAPADRATVTFDLPAATPGATIAVCRNALKPDALIRAFEAHPALSTEARRFESAEAIRAHLTANRVATIGLTTSDCSRDAPTSETACIVLPASNAIFEIRMSGNDGDLEKSFRIIGYRPELMQGDVPRTNEGRFAVIDVGYVMARTARSDRVTCVTAKNWSAKPSHQVVQLRYGDPGDAPPNRR